MTIGPASKLTLKTVHQEIDLLDRKIAHLHNFEEFGSDDERQKALGKLTRSRDKLVKAAKQMVEQGIEYDPKELPRSFRAELEASKTASAA